MADRPLSAEEKMRTATRRLVADLRRAGHNAAAIRTTVARGIATALEGGERIGGTDGNGQRAEVLTSAAAVFRLVMSFEGIDRADQRIQERWLAVVQDELARALAE